MENNSEEISENEGGSEKEVEQEEANDLEHQDGEEESDVTWEDMVGKALQSPKPTC